MGSDAGSDDIVWDVFLAHSSRDKAFAMQLYKLLTAAGVTVCFDEEVLRPGDNWHAFIRQYLRQSSMIVMLVSPNTQDAHFENSEIIIAITLVRREGRRLVPVKLTADTEMPYGTGQLHYVTAYGEDSLPGLADQLVDLVQNPERLTPVRATQVWCNRIPVTPELFTGRDELLEQLGTAAGTGTTRVLTQTVSGLGGVGQDDGRSRVC